ncbi:hypothetical protein KXR53_25810 [Inquilinus limosus]|uniref:hypothetical protein n=1 Tax=Inquilinus limosus TaxID=171674 RepID=UPI003F142E16
MSAASAACSGGIIAILFWGFNAVMVTWLVRGIGATSEQYAGATSEAAKAGTAIGATVGIGILLTIWVMGAIVLGLMMFFTRGKKITVTKDVP